MKGPLRRNPFRRRTSDPVPQESQPTLVAPPQEAAPITPEALPAGVAPEDVAPARPSFRDRGRLRRRMRYLRSVRELGFRDLGGLVFDLHRFARRNDELVLGKLAALDAVDRELRAIERVLEERRDIIELREPGVAACPRCGALHGSDARFCPQCGTQFSGPLAMGGIDGPAPVTSGPGHAATTATPAPAAPAAPDAPAATPVSGALEGNPPPPAAPEQSVNGEAPTTVEPSADEPPEPGAAVPPADGPPEPGAAVPPADGPPERGAAVPPAEGDQPTQAMPAVSSGDRLAPRERPGS
jgi:ribosomal protein L40E